MLFASKLRPLLLKFGSAYLRPNINIEVPAWYPKKA
jgi:hypothetical protein